MGQEIGGRSAIRIRLLLSGLRGLLAEGLTTEPEQMAYKELQAELSGLLARKAQGWTGTVTTKKCGFTSLKRRTRSAFQRRSGLATMDSLVNDEGSRVDTIEELVETCKSFYEVLYGEQRVKMDVWPDLFKDFPALNPDQAAELDLDVWANELLQAAKSLPKGKTPGPDGLPGEFYLRFWGLLGGALSDVFNCCVERGSLPTSSREGLIKLICKDPSRKEDLSAWRPISLLNTDYKLFAKVLQERLQRVVHHVISPVQAAAVPGRSIQQHLFALRDIFYWAINRGVPAFLASFDQEKAFDRVSHAFLLQVLKCTGLGERFQSYVKVLYASAQSRVVVNGRPSTEFEVRRGVRQGCPLSPTLYALVIETAIRLLSRDSLIPRLPVPGSQRFPTMFAFADDLTVCLPSPAAVRHVLDCLAVYCGGSGAAVNVRKSTVMALGPDFPYSDVYGIPVVRSSRILGILFNRRGPLISNWTQELSRMEECASSLHDLELDFRERGEIITRHICSRFWFFGTAFQPATATARRAHSIIYRFFWGGRPELVQRSMLMRPPESGGWNVRDVLLFCGALGLATLFKVLQDSGHISHDLALFFVGTYARDFGRAIDHTRPHAGSLLTFYKIMQRYAVSLQRSLPGIDFSTWTARQLYEALCDIRYPLSSASVDTNRRRIAWDILAGSRVDILWQHSHAVLSVRSRLYRFGLTRSTACVTCGQMENHLHVFYRCINAAAMWRKVSQLYHIRTLSYRTVQMLDPLPIPERKEPAFVLLVSEVQYQLWCSRTRAVYGSQNESLVKVLFACRVALKTRLQEDLRALGLSQFRRRWKNHYNLFLLVKGQVVLRL